MSGDLAQLQRWMLQVIVHPGGVAAGMASPAALRERDVSLANIEQIIPPSEKQTSLERLAVYGSAYYARLLECLREFFPCLTYAIGAESFDDFALLYLQQHPSSHYSLNRLADNFVEFLEANRPERASPEPDWPDFMIDLARLEHAIEQVFDGPGPEESGRLSASRLQSLAAETWPSARLRLVPWMQLFACQFSVNSFYTAWKQHQSPSIPAPAGQWMAVFRREYMVRRYELSRPQYELLQALQGGATVGEAISAAARHVTDQSAFADELRSWFEFWASEQFFADIE